MQKIVSKLTAVHVPARCGRTLVLSKCVAFPFGKASGTGGSCADVWVHTRTCTHQTPLEKMQGPAKTATTTQGMKAGSFQFFYLTGNWYLGSWKHCWKKWCDGKFVPPIFFSGRLRILWCSCWPTMGRHLTTLAVKALKRHVLAEFKGS